MMHIKTTYHPSGCYTCMARQDNESMWNDLPGSLFCNTDRVAFYREVSKLVENLRSRDNLASFDDMASGIDS